MFVCKNLIILICVRSHYNPKHVCKQTNCTVNFDQLVNVFGDKRQPW